MFCTLTNFYTLAENYNQNICKKRRKIGDLIYDHGLTNSRFGANLFFITFFMRYMLARLTPLHLKNVD